MPVKQVNCGSMATPAIALWAICIENHKNSRGVTDDEVFVNLVSRRAGIKVLHIICLLVALVGSTAWAVEPPTREEIEQRLEELRPAEGQEPDAAAQEKIDTLQAALDDLAAKETAKTRLEDLEKRVEKAPTELRELQQALSENQDDTPASSLEALESLDLETLESRLKEASDALRRDQDRLSQIETRLLGTQTLPERAQQGISDATQAVEESRRTLEDLEARDVDESDPRHMHARTQRALAEQRLALHQRELATNSRLRELAQQRRDLLQRRVTSQEAQVLALQGVIDQRRRERSEQAIAEAVQDEPDDVASHPLVSEAQQVNRDMSLELLRITSQANELVRQGLEVRRQLDQVRQLQRGMDEHVEAIRGSTLLSRILREQRQALPKVEVRGGLKDEIADWRLRQFELDRQRETLKDADTLAQEQMASATDDEMSPELVAPLAQLFRARRDLLEQLEPTYGEMLSTAIELQLHQQQLLSTSRSLRDTINKQLFWVANARPLDLAWLLKLPDHLRTEWREGEWRQALPTHWTMPDARALLGLPLLLAAAGLLLLRRTLKRRLLRLHDEIGHLRRDSQAHTPKAIMFNALLAMPLPLVLASIGLALLFGGQGVAQNIGWSLAQIALAWAVVAWARRLLTADGVAVRQFYWPSAYVSRLHRWLLWLFAAMIPVLLVAPLARDAGINLNLRPLAMGILLAGLLGMSLSLAKLIMAHTPFFGVKFFRLVLGLAMAAVPLFLGGLVVSGYAYTALSLVSRFVITLYVLGVWILVEAAVVRGLAVAARRLAYRRALARRRALQENESESGLDVVEEPPLDMKQVNQQSLRLAKLALLIGFLVVLYLVWADLLTVLGYLEQVMLLGGEGQQGADLVGGAVSVADAIVALLVVALTLMLARNLPGLLEVMVLSRLELKQGSAYAISSLLSYTIVGTGVVMALGTLGVSWSKLQWLVAALGVGLGFGLQEIFANFISGLIILFERPVRIGDTITLGNLTGTVSRIRIRATTVTDFDRKEIIIPNKTFVTDQLINWSLSDNITRVILTYGVELGSDHRLVQRLLQQAADENDRVLRDPAPETFFMRYSANAMEFELRIFVNSLGDRLYASDELNGRVGELLAEHDLDIAFNQMDVWLHRSDGARTKLQSRSSVSSSSRDEPRHPPPGAAGDPGDVDGGGDGGGR
ncbi:mechanosensitive channel MscK [Halomonas eurihalina]|uniref:Mechanosensitive channel MscK n=1 Tax=Halomonas eurihalina TaxID=42566 RepID=A0A5D9DF38_HALER|nr:mechanosensitive channel MscK [Halomonas eurihalina]MDR5858102.1 mechanosensitive channel MscK [Halomonas eurihalina]TZG41391.1 mechanosensitive channel MscK [Halomonas eurihalina]